MHQNFILNVHNKRVSYMSYIISMLEHQAFMTLHNIKHTYSMEDAVSKSVDEWGETPNLSFLFIYRCSPLYKFI